MGGPCRADRRAYLPAPVNLVNLLLRAASFLRQAVVLEKRTSTRHPPRTVSPRSRRGPACTWEPPPTSTLDENSDFSRLPGPAGVRGVVESKSLVVKSLIKKVEICKFGRRGFAAPMNQLVAHEKAKGVVRKGGLRAKSAIWLARRFGFCTSTQASAHWAPLSPGSICSLRRTR